MVMKGVRVVYATKTKHSKKIAEAIGKELRRQGDQRYGQPKCEKTGITIYCRESTEVTVYQNSWASWTALNLDNVK